MQRLEGLGLSGVEARVYVALLMGGSLAARDLVDVAETTRSSVYLALRSLEDAGLVEGGAGYASRYRAVPPERALPSLIEDERVELTEALQHKEDTAKELGEELARLADSQGADSPPAEVVEVLRNPRVVVDRFSRLQQQANREICMFVKAPFVHTGGNPDEEQALARGVRIRCLYEEESLGLEGVRPYLEGWVAAGEEARVTSSKLPFKLIIVDSQTSLMPLETPEAHRDVTSVLIRNASLAEGLQMLFDFLWESATLIPPRVQ